VNGVGTANFGQAACARLEQSLDNVSGRKVNVNLRARAIPRLLTVWTINQRPALVDCRNPVGRWQDCRIGRLQAVKPLTAVGDAAQNIVNLNRWQIIAVAAPR